MVCILGNLAPSFESLIRSTSNGHIQIQYAEKRQWQGINGIVHLEGVGNPILRGRITMGQLTAYC